MIFLPFDECQFFDFLSILEVKIANSGGEQKFYLGKQISFYENSLREQIGDEKFQKVSSSKEYQKLKNVNQDIFDLTEKCVCGYEIPFLIAIKLNNVRGQLKNSLQKKFFGKNSSEIKLKNS